MDGKRLEYKGEAALEEIERLTSEADKVQEEILKQILTTNCETEYLSKYLKKGTKDISLFKKFVPVITYKDIQPYIQRIENGEGSSLLTGHQITEMLCSSGTSAGEPKMTPSIAEDLDRRTFLYNLIMPIINQHVSGMEEGKAMYLNFVKAEKTTACGLPARAVLTSYYKSKHFRCRPSGDPFNDYTSPDAAVLFPDTAQSMYCQLLSGLVHRRSVLRLGAVFASALLRAVSSLHRLWPSLCRDIRLGRLDPDAVPDPDLRAAVAAAVLPSPEPSLADEIEGICSGEWGGIICRLWPRAKYVEAVVTGSMAQYVPSLRYYTGGKLPLVCTMYASSECFFGVNLDPFCDPDDVAFTLLPNMGYFEFVPLGENGMDRFGEDEDVPNDKLVGLVDVKRGCYYELVVTTFAGLNRYRIGDVLQVKGFHNKAPQFRFICRRNVLLSIDNDKTNEEDLHKSVSAAAKSLLDLHGVLLSDYTSHADTSLVPGHYVLFWELRSLLHHRHHHHHHNHHHHHRNGNGTAVFDVVTSHGEALRECCAAVEEELDYTYRRCRSNDGSVGPLEIRVVEPGTFEALMDHFIAQGASINQYKTPRCINSAKALKLLDDHVMASFFIPRDPKWLP